MTITNTLYGSDGTVIEVKEDENNVKELTGFVYLAGTELNLDVFNYFRHCMSYFNTALKVKEVKKYLSIDEAAGPGNDLNDAYFDVLIEVYIPELAGKMDEYWEFIEQFKLRHYEMATIEDVREK